MSASLHDHLAAVVTDVSVPGNLLDTVERRAVRIRHRRRAGLATATALGLTVLISGATVALPSHHSPSTGRLSETGAPTPAVTGPVSVTLRPVDDDAPATQVASTAAVLRRRLSADGIPSGTVTTAGTTLTMSAPAGTDPSTLTALARTGVLLLRQVATGCTGLPTPSCVLPDPGLRAGVAAARGSDLGPLPAGSAPITWTRAQATSAWPSLECADAAQQLRVADFTAASWALGCGPADNPGRYLMEPAAITEGSVSSVRVTRELTNAGNEQLPTPYYEVDLGFADGTFAKQTQATATGVIQNAFVLDGAVLDAPANTSAITGDAQIVGFSKEEANLLAAEIGAGPLPLDLTVVSVSAPSTGASANPTGSAATTEPAATGVINPTAVPGVVVSA